MGKSKLAFSDVLDRCEGFVLLKPTYVRRPYTDGGRLWPGGCPGSTFNPKTKLWISERWIASAVLAVNPHPIRGEGYSWIDGPIRMTLKDAVAAEPLRMLGPKICHAHGPEFRVLTKILDGRDPIIYHVHAKDAHVKRYRKSFRGHRYGKSEAYYFLEAPKGTDPILHLGMYPGITRKDLLAAIAKGHDHVLELSPPFMQRFGQGFFMPAGMPHRPGTALTLEVQQPSDVATLLEPEFCGIRLGARMHPGFKTLSEAIKLVDFQMAQQRDLERRYALHPKPVAGRRQGGGQEDWIFAPAVTEKFSGKRLRVQRRFLSRERAPYALLVWRGRGRLNRRSIKAGQELFVSYQAARQEHEFVCSGDDVLEVFKVFPPAIP